MSKVRGVSVGLVFLLGCAVGGAASRFVVPRASAQQAAVLTRWEYLCMSGEELRVHANSTGSQGWELVAVGGGVANDTWCFKRPKG